MSRPRKVTPAARVARDRTAGELVAHLRGRPSTPGMSRETALSVAGSWRRLLQKVGPDDWENTRLGDLDVNSLLDIYAEESGVSAATIASMRSRLPKGLRVFEDSIVAPRRRAVPAAPDAPGGATASAGDGPRPGGPRRAAGDAVGVPLVGSLVLGGGWRFDLRLPGDCTGREYRLVTALLGLFADPTSVPPGPQAATVRLRPDWTFALELPDGWTARQLERIRGFVDLHAPDDPGP